MMARAILVLLLMTAFTFEVNAGVRDPNTVVEDSQKVLSAEAFQKAWNKVTTKVKNLWETAKKGLNVLELGDDKVAKDNKAKKSKQAKKTESQKKVSELAGSMPEYKTPDKGFDAKDVEKAKKSIAPGLTQVVKPSVPAQPDLKRNKAGVPVFPLYDVKTSKDKAGKVKTVKIPKKHIPKLNIGREAKISKNDFMLPQFQFSLASHKDPRPLKSPAMIPGPDISRFSARPIVKAEPTKDLKLLSKDIDKVVTKEIVNKIIWKSLPEKQVQLKAYKPLSEPQQKMLAALILFNKGGQCHFVMGLFDQIAQDTKVEDEAKFHLGACAHSMKLYSSSFAILSKLIDGKNPDYTTEALEILSADLPEQFESPFYFLVKGLKDPKWIPAKIQDQVYYLAAKGAFKVSKYKAAKTYAEKVAEKAPQFAKAQYISGIASYSRGHKKTAIAKLEGLRAWMEDKKISDKNLNSLTALNLARIKFNSSQYKEAHELYMKVDKEHPTWVQALVEQGWTQLSMGDYSGAIGNMYSLHSPYFTAVYKPESFVVRSIGYLNICQYGDAYKTLSYLEKDYRQWFSDAKKYMKTKKLASDYHDTVVTYLKGKSDQNVDGLPFQVVREMARQKFYLNKQAALNASIDEISRHKGIDEKIREEKARIRWKLQKAEERLAGVNASIKNAKVNKTLAKEINSLQAQFRNERDFVIGYKYQLAMLELGRQGFIAFKAKSEDRIGKERYVLQEAAGRFLVSYLTKLQKDMGHLLDNNEFLRYEVFSGAGESIRYQVAGGEVSGEANRIPASVKPQKIMNWDFEGEYWEDEIGSYRSSLQNLCPAQGKAQAEKKRKDQAALAKEYAQ